MAQASFSADIKPLFAVFGVELDNYTYMSNPDNANKVLATLSPHDGEPPSMPPGGPYWTADQRALFAQWRTRQRNFFSRPKAAPIRVGREGVKVGEFSRWREELVVNAHDACVRDRVSEFASSGARTSS